MYIHLRYLDGQRRSLTTIHNDKWAQFTRLMIFFKKLGNDVTFDLYLDIWYQAFVRGFRWSFPLFFSSGLYVHTGEPDLQGKT